MKHIRNAEGSPSVKPVEPSVGVERIAPSSSIELSQRSAEDAKWNRPPVEQRVDKIKYFLYARKSSESEDRQMASIESQIDELKKLASENNLEIVDILSEAQSAKEPGRPVFNKMMMRIAKGEGQGIVCWKLNRLARNPVDGGQISWLLQQGIIKHVQTYGRSYYPTDNVLMMNVEFGMANQFVRDLSVDTKRGMRAKAERGWIPGPAPVGYLHNPIKKHDEKEVLKDETKFDLVRKCWDMMLTGAHTVPQVWEVAVHQWDLTGRMGAKINLSNMYLIFTNPFYCGEFEYPLRSGIWHHGKHERMVTRTEFEKVQTIMKGRSHPRPKIHDISMRGPIRCGECGAVITAEEKIKIQKNGNRHEYIYYHCTKRMHPECSQGRVTEKDLQKQVMEILSDIEIPQEFYAWAMDVLRESNNDESVGRQKIMESQRVEYDKCVKVIDALIDMRARGEITEQEFAGRRASLMTEKNRLQGILNDADKGVDEWLNTADKYFSFAANARQKFENGTSAEIRELLTLLGSDLSLKQGKLSVSLAKPLVVIEKLAPEARRINKRFGPLKNADDTRALRVLYAKNSVRGRIVEDVRTRIATQNEYVYIPDLGPVAVRV
jgi:DNA invertase Pin-like site-specific DNA recombinase/predicted metal-binding protein